jgi:hypothetical protein
MDHAMNNRTQLADLASMDATQIARLPIDQLAVLADDLDELKSDAKRLGDLLGAGLHQRFGDAAASLRHAEGKDTGRVRLVENGFAIIADLPRKTSWNQVLLADAVATIRGLGEEPADYVTTELSVPEARFKAWPPRLRALVEPARTVGAGRPTYVFERRDA